MNIFGDETRGQHFRVGILLGFLFTMLCVLGAMTTAEFKDEKHGGKWDWSDWAWGKFGGLIGQAAQIGVVLWIFM